MFFKFGLTALFAVLSLNLACASDQDQKKEAEIKVQAPKPWMQVTPETTEKEVRAQLEKILDKDTINKTLAGVDATNSWSSYNKDADSKDSGFRKLVASYLQTCNLLDAQIYSSSLTQQQKLDINKIRKNITNVCDTLWDEIANWGHNAGMDMLNLMGKK